MALTNSWPGVSGAATTTDARKNLAGMLATDTSGVARAGVLPSHTNALVTSRADLNLDIAAFTGAAVQFGGPVLIANDGVAQLPSALVSPGSGTNYYVIYAKQNESTAPGTDANNNRVFGAQLSTVSLATARGALPSGALELATVEMPTGKTATNQSGVIITQTAKYTAAEGGTVLVRTATELSAWTPHDGARAFQIDADLNFQRVDGAWVAVAEQTLGKAFNGSGTGQSSIGTTIVAVTGMTFSVVLPIDTNVAFKFSFQVIATDVNAAVQVDLVDGATVIRSAIFPANGTDAVGVSAQVFSEFAVESMTAGSHTIKLQVKRVGIAGTLSLPHPTLNPTFMIAKTY